MNENGALIKISLMKMHINKLTEKILEPNWTKLSKEL